MNPQPRTGGQILVAQLVAQGVRHVFCVPGESYLEVLDALHDSPINLTVCRHEGGAAMMAEAYGKLTGEPGVCMVTRAPGATHAAGGVHIAKQDSTPFIMLVGQVDDETVEREGFQEINYTAVFGSMSKWSASIQSARRIPEFIARAFSVAQSGRAGPVVLAMPENVLRDKVAVADAPKVSAINTAPSAESMAQFVDLLHKSQRPVMILGGSRWDESAVSTVTDFAERLQLPVAVSFRRQMLFSSDHPCFIGDLGFGINPKLAQRVSQADLIILVGGRMSEVPSQDYTLMQVPKPQQKLVHIHPDAQEINRVYLADVAINATPIEFAMALPTTAPPQPYPWANNTPKARDEFLVWRNLDVINTPGSMKMEKVMAFLNERLPPETIVCNGAGNFATWVHRFYRFRGYGTQLAPTCGFMGYGLPAGIAAKTLYPQKPVLVFAGDGDFLMTSADFATAVQYSLPLLVVVVDNAMYGTIRMHQEIHFPGRVSGTTLKSPDFSALAKAYGGYGERVERWEDFPSAFERAWQCGLPALLHCPIEPEGITPTATLSALREKSLRAKKD